MPTPHEIFAHMPPAVAEQLFGFLEKNEKPLYQTTIDTLAKQPPLERLGSTGDIAEVISFLAGPARWINGQTIRANGGII